MSSECRFPALRAVVCANALTWLAKNSAAPGTSVITSLPDLSEVSAHDFVAWREWFIQAARTIVRWVPEDGVAIFYQSDIRHEGVWVDKSYLILKAAEAEGASLLWRKVVCRHPPGTISQGRPTYSHMLCVTRGEFRNVRCPGPDVLADAGAMSWPRAMGEAACRVACRFLLDETPTRRVVDPFCGEGGALIAANAVGLEAIGVDLSSKRCRTAVCASEQYDRRARRQRIQARLAPAAVETQE